MLCTLRRVLHGDQVLAHPSHLLGNRRHCFAGVFEQSLLKNWIAPCLGDHLRADMRADLGFVKLDDAIEGGGFDIALVDENRLQRAHPEIHLGQSRAFVVIVIMSAIGEI